MGNLDGKVQYDGEELKANFNGLLYLVTECMAVNLELLKVLQEKDLLSEEETDKVLQVTGNKEELTRVYNEVFTRFVGYYQAIRKMIEDEGQTSDTPGENLVQGEETSDVK